MTKVSIKNFQSIKKVDFNIEGFTVIIGKNNVGKSAIIRAMESALTNQVGKDFIRRGEKKTEVNLQRDGINIEWKKGLSATYKVNGESFSKLNREVPQPLIDAGFEKMKIGDKKVLPLIASQFDPLFLLDKPGSVVTEVLASLYNIDVLSAADDLCQKTLKSQKSILKTRESDLKLLQEKLEKFIDFESIKQTVESLVEKEKELQDLETEISLLTHYEEEAQTLAESLKKLHSIKKIKVPAISETESLMKEVKQFCDWNNIITQTEKKIRQQKEFLGTFDINEIITANKSIISAMDKFNEIVIMEEEFKKIVISTRATRDEFKTSTEKLEQKENEKAQIKICPLCEQPLPIISLKGGF